MPRSKHLNKKNIESPEESATALKHVVTTDTEVDFLRSTSPTESTEADRLLSALLDLEEDIELESQQQLRQSPASTATHPTSPTEKLDPYNTSSIQNDDAIWQATTPIIADNKYSDKDDNESELDTSSLSQEQALTQQVHRERALTPTKPLLDKFATLSQSWSEAKSRTEHFDDDDDDDEQDSKPSARHAMHESLNHPTNMIVRTHPNHATSGVYRTPNRNLKRPSARTPTRTPTRSIATPSSRQRRDHFAFSNNNNDDDLSVGASTISSMSTAESVFDRLYRMGKESAQRKKELAEQAASPASPRSYKSEASTPRRLSYTPKNHPSISTPQHRSARTTPQRKNRIAAYTDGPSVASKSRSNRRLSITPRRLHNSNQSVRSQHTVGSSHSSLTEPSTSSRSTFVEASQTSSSNSIHNRLYRNEKRRERLWKAPKPFTPKKSPFRFQRTTPTRTNTSAARQLSIQTRLDTKPPSPVAEDPSPQTNLTAASTQSQDPSPSNQTQATNDSSLAAASLLLDELLGEDTPTSATTFGWNDKRSKNLQLAPIVSEDQQEDIESKATTIDEDLAEIEAIGQVLSSASQDGTPPHAGITDTPSTKVLEEQMDEIVGPSMDVSRDSLDQALSEIEEIGQQLSSASSSSPLALLNASMAETSADQDLMDIQQETSMVQQENIQALSLLNASMADTSFDDDLRETPRESSMAGTPARSGKDTSHEEEWTPQRTTKPEDACTPQHSIPHQPSGFMSLDEGTGGLVLDYRGPMERLNTPIRRRRQRERARQREMDDSPCMTPHQLRHATAITIQTAWRKYYSEILAVAHVVDFSSLKWGQALPPHVQCRCIEKASRSLHRDEYLARGLRVDEDFVVAAWETSIAMQEPLTLSVVVEGSIHLDRMFWGRTWSYEKISHRFLKVGLAREHLKRQMQAIQILQQWTRQRLGFVTVKHVAKEEQNTVKQEEPPIELQDTIIVQENQAATIIQNWFRLETLQSAVNDSMETKDELHRTLVEFSTPDRPSTPGSEIQDAKLVLAHSSSLEYWMRSLKTPPKMMRSWSSGDESPEAWVEKRAATLALQNIVRTYVMSLRRVRSNRKASLIQSHWRRYHQCKVYHKTKSATVRVQKAWRCHNLRKKRNVAATRIQGVVRTSKAVQQWRMLRLFTVTIQGWARMHIEERRYVATCRVARSLQRIARSRSDRQKFLRLRSAVTSLQQLHRAKTTRKIFQQEWASAVLIQAAWRGFQAHHEWWLMLGSLRIIQRNARLYIAKASSRRETKSAIAIQCNLRRCLVQRDMQRRHFAAVQIQSQVRRHLAVATRNELLWSIVFIQSLWRGAIDRTKAFEDLQIYRSRIAAATLLQCHIRSYLAMKRFQQRLVLIIRLQSFLRKLQAVRRFRRKQNAAVVLQAYFKMEQIRMEYENTRASIIMIQAQARGMTCRSALEYDRGSAIMIQGVWRGALQRKFLKKQHEAARTIQAALRSHHCRSLYLNHRNAAVVLQSQIRLFLQEREGAELHLAATQLQRCWRGKHSRALSSSQRQSAILIQAECRRYMVKSDLKRQNVAAIEIQRVCRTFFATRSYELVRKQVHEEELMSSASLIAKTWRGSRNRRLFLITRKACIALQSTIRGRQQMKRFQKVIDATIHIQSVSRGWIVSQKFCRLKTASILIQKQWRGSSARESYESCRIALIMIQALIRGCTLRKIARSQKMAAISIEDAWSTYKMKKDQAVKRRMKALYQESRRGKMAKRIQRVFRQWRSSKQEKAAMKIQSHWRRYWAQRDYYMKLASVILIQSEVRRQQAMLLFGVSLYAAVVIQTHWRTSLARAELDNKRASASMIQALARGTQTRQRLLDQQHRAIAIQSIWRGYRLRRLVIDQLRRRELYQESRKLRAARRIVRFFRLLQQEKRNSTSASTIQRTWRARKAKEVFLSKRKAVIQIQSRYRIQLAKTRFHCVACSIIKIQSSWRAALSRQTLSKARVASVMLQAVVRGHMQRKLFMRSVQIVARREHAAARVLQQWIRMVKAKRKLHDSARCAVTIQKFWRGSLSRNLFSRARVAATMIQALSRGQTARLRLKQAEVQSEKDRAAAALSLQSYWRGAVLSREFRLTRKSALTVQKFVRSKLALVAYKTKLSAALRIQRAWRRTVAEWMYMKCRVAATMMQALVRGSAVRKRFRHFTAAMIIQKTWRCFEERKRYEAQKEAILKIQSSCRARLIGNKYDTKLSREEEMAQAVILLQRWWRCSVEDRRYQKILTAIIYMQAWFRMVKTRNRYWFLRLPKDTRCKVDVAARRIQLCFLLWKMRMAVLEMQSSAVILHRCMRGQLARSAALFALNHMNSSMQYAPISPVARTSSPTNEQARSAFNAWDRALQTARVTAAVVIQTAARRMLAQKMVLERFGVSFEVEVLEMSIRISECEAAVQIQRAYRQWQNRRQLAATKLQAFARRSLLYKQILELKFANNRKISATRIQTQARKLLAHKCFVERQTQVDAVRNIQRLSKAILARQSFVGLLSQGKTRSLAAIRIQQAFRKFRIQRAVIQREKRANAVLNIQRLSKVVLAQKVYVRFLQNRRSRTLAAVHIQRAFRGVLRDKTIRFEQTKSATDIQALWRGHSQRRFNGELPSACLMVQSIIRKWLAVQQYHELRVAACTIKRALTSYWRGKASRKVQASIALADYLKAIESRCRAKVDSLESLGNDTSREAQRLLLAQEEAMALANSKLPAFVDHAKLLSAELEAALVPGPRSRNIDQERPAKILTPVRSNKKLLSVVSSEDKIGSLSDLLRHGRTAANRQTLQPPSVEGVTGPTNTNHTNTIKVDMATKVPAVTFQKGVASPAECNNKQNTKTTAPGESFFEGASKEIPSPIKLDSGDWDWAGEW